MAGQASPLRGQRPQRKRIVSAEAEQAAPKKGGTGTAPSSSRGGRRGCSAEIPTSTSKSGPPVAPPTGPVFISSGILGQAPTPKPKRIVCIKKRPSGGKRTVTEADLRPPPPNLYITFLDRMTPEAKAKAQACIAAGLPFTVGPLLPEPPSQPPPPPPASTSSGAATSAAAPAKAAPPTPTPAKATPKKRPPSDGMLTPAKKPRVPRFPESDRDGLGVLMLEEGAEGAEAGEGVTREALLAKDHLLLRADIVGRAFGFCNQMVQFSSVWNGDPADLNSELWENYLQPTAERVVGFARGRVFDGALAELLGVVLFTVRQHAWLRQPQAHLEEWELRGFFERMSSAWGMVLAQSDQVLGLAPAEGKRGGYRPRLLALLRTWQDQANRALAEEGFDGSKGKKLVVSVVEP